jgi:signal transduction histidine kinase
MSRRIEHQMAEIERMARTRRELVANVSHDLRTPIASLRGYLETLALKRETLSGEEREEYLQIALRQSERLGELVDELFELTKLDAREIEPRPETLQFAELVQDNVQRFQLRAEEQGVRLGADFDPDLPAVLVDVALMERALENLIENAIRFTPSGGTVTVELEERSDRLRVRVVDTGSGIDEEDLPRILDRSYRSRSVASSKGAGLGLAITRRILELHGSELEIRSAPGRGTTVSFLLETVPRVSSRPDVAVPVAAGGSALSSAV